MAAQRPGLTQALGLSMANVELEALPESRASQRDALRCVGYELVKYSKTYALQRSASVCHQPQDYKFGFHRIDGVYDGRVFIQPSPTHHCSEPDIDRWVDFYLNQEEPTKWSDTWKWFKDPANAFLGIAVAPFALTLFGGGLLGERAHRREQERRRSVVNTWHATPFITEPIRRGKT